MDVCDKKRGGCGAHHELFPLSCIDRSQRGNGQDERKEVATISQRAAQIVEGAYTKECEDVACPRCDRELQVFNTASGPILRCRGWSLGGTPCTLIKACHNVAVVPTGDGGSTSGSGGTGTLPRRDDGTQDPPPIDDWTAQVQALAANPAWALEQFAQWHLHPENGGSTGDRWSMDTGSNTTSEPESMNHHQDWSGNARFNDEVKDEPVLTASHVLKEHTFEIRQEDEVPELAETGLASSTF